MWRLNSTTSTDDDNNGGGSGGGSNSRWVRACHIDEIPDGQTYRFSDYNILLANHDGAIRATDLICTHAEADLSTGFLGPDGIRCPLHLSVFDLKTGKPCNPPAEKALRVYNVKIDNGHVHVEV